MKQISQWIACVAFMAVSSLGANAQSPAANYPAKPVRMVIPFAAGGATDIIGRLLAQKLSEAWRQPVLVENRAGVGGTIGSEYVARSPADGYTLVMGGGTTHTAGPAVNPKTSYNPITDFTAVTLVATFPNILVISPSVPANSIQQMIELLRANPGKYNFASSGAGGTPHLSAELFMMMTGTKMTHVPFKGSGQALTEVMAGRVEVYFDNIAAAWPLAQQGKIRALGVTGLERSPGAPNLPAIAEVLPGYEANSFVGLLMPAGVQGDIPRRFAAETRRALQEPDIAKRMQELSAMPVGSTPDEFSAFIRKDIERWRQVVAKAGIVIE
ncbi:MAG: tripartite tricarboxylate transporter substrate binding protein [Betaproteobacteria bacterium]|nr:tripartite tricarboxylate transporter substrate binding protein [Betaproteobacteria bacterium]